VTAFGSGLGIRFSERIVVSRSHAIRRFRHAQAWINESERLRLPSCLLIETASDDARAHSVRSCSRRFRCRLAVKRPERTKTRSHPSCIARGKGELPQDPSIQQGDDFAGRCHKHSRTNIDAAPDRSVISANLHACAVVSRKPNESIHRRFDSKGEAIKRLIA
jgi:hypothetical protein